MQPSRDGIPLVPGRVATQSPGAISPSVCDDDLAIEHSRSVLTSDSGSLPKRRKGRALLPTSTTRASPLPIANVQQSCSINTATCAPAVRGRRRGAATVTRRVQNATDTRVERQAPCALGHRCLQDVHVAHRMVAGDVCCCWHALAPAALHARGSGVRAPRCSSSRQPVERKNKIHRPFPGFSRTDSALAP